MQALRLWSRALVNLLRLTTGYTRTAGAAEIFGGVTDPKATPADQAARQIMVHTFDQNSGVTWSVAEVSPSLFSRGMLTGLVARLVYAEGVSRQRDARECQGGGVLCERGTRVCGGRRLSQDARPRPLCSCRGTDALEQNARRVGVPARRARRHPARRGHRRIRTSLLLAGYVLTTRPRVTAPRRSYSRVSARIYLCEAPYSPRRTRRTSRRRGCLTPSS